jgi:hypothetical protein
VRSNFLHNCDTVPIAFLDLDNNLACPIQIATKFSSVREKTPNFLWGTTIALVMARRKIHPRVVVELVAHFVRGVVTAETGEDSKGFSATNPA